MTNVLNNIQWLGHDGFIVKDNDTSMVIDPFQVEKGEPVDIIFVTHAHYDHCSVDDIPKFLKDSTIIVTEPQSAEMLEKAGIKQEVKVVKPGDTLEVADVTVEVVPAYNTNKEFHPKDKNWLGFIITVGGQRIYHSGDTDHIPEMKDFDVDIALLPVSGTYVMTADEAVEAVEAAKDIGPKTAIPMHYDAIVGTAADADTFKNKLSGVCEVFLPERY